MPKTGAPIAGVAPLPGDGFLRELAIPLNVDERRALREMFTSSVFQKAWKNALTVSPSALVDGAVLDSVLGSVKAVNRLHEIRGWEMFRAALAIQVMDKPLPKSRVPENYPEGLEIAKVPKT
jgi:hypothetical protein